MREVRVDQVCRALFDCVERASFNLGEAETNALQAALERETSPIGRSILKELLENAEIARLERRPLCQDTGLAVLFLEIGQEVHLTGKNLEEALQETIRNAYDRLYLRKSVLDHPLSRINTGTNTPAILHVRIVKGDRVKLTFAAKGGG